jgi:lipopolysaccharide/colanic/teichoic acid biosynthesis glycosyltransferase
LVQHSDAAGWASLGACAEKVAGAGLRSSAALNWVVETPSLAKVYGSELSSHGVVFLLKRLVDIVGAGLGLILFAPLMIFVAYKINRQMGRPVLFRQVRPGLHGTPFKMIKFRTMRDAVDASGTPLPDKDRMTPFGQFLRSSSLDELPELWNVLKGDMSLVGPRPLLMEYLPLYSKEQFRRHDVRPGVTGWAQINGRNAISWDEKFALDVWYVDHKSLALDFLIIGKTIRKVIKRDGISADGEATMPKFTGERS